MYSSCLLKHFNNLLLAILIFKVCQLNIVEGYSDSIIETRCRIVKGQVNKEYIQSLTHDESVIYMFNIDRSYFVDAFNTNIRVEVETDRRTSLQHPILFAIGQRKYINTFEVPTTFDSSEDDDRTNAPIYYKAGQNLCVQRSEDQEVEGRNITLRVTTSSPRRVFFRLKLILNREFQIPIGREIELEVSPTAPRYMGFQFSRPDVSVVKIRAKSDTLTCLTISVQSARCPIFDRENNVRYQGLWQTMTRQAAMTLDKSHRFVDGFVVVLVAHDTDEKCSKSSASYLNPYPDLISHENYTDGRDRNQGLIQPSLVGPVTKKMLPRTKTVRLLITNESAVKGWIIFLCMFIPVISTIMLLIVVTLLFRNRHQWMRVEAEQKLTSVNCGLLNSTRNDPTSMQTSHTLMLNDLGIVDSDDESHQGSQHRESNNVNGQTVQFYEMEKDGVVRNRNASRSEFQWKADLYLSDFVQKDPLQAKKSARRFYWTIVIVAIFYCIPVYQLILHYLRVLYRTGEYDICYYNYLCAHRLGLLVDFNHFWSNVSYVIFGFAYVFFVNRKATSMVDVPLDKNWEIRTEESFFKKCCGYPKIPRRRDHGIPENWGMFYALGIALAMEGVLSAAYHLCPNQSSFQFDTCFMYIISVLIVLKIHQFRHPVHLGANHTFAILAAFVLISVIGLMFEFQGENAKTIYRWGFICLQFLTMILITIYFYAIGYVKKRDGDIISTWQIFCHLDQLKNRRVNCDRLILPGISFLLGIAVLLYVELTSEDFATYLLYLLVANVIGTTVYYVGIMKPMHGEFKNRTWVQPTLYFLGAGIIGGFAVRYFMSSPAEWELSAAASRAENEECMGEWFPFHPFYDSHDVWHFLSAAALFLSFMALLIVDDDLLTTPQSKIACF